MPLITREIKDIFDALKPAECRLVGGAVRDFLLDGTIAEDIDIATNAIPETVMEKLTNKGMKVIPTGLKHGTVTVVYKKHHYEITTLRHDIETHGRHATVSFTDKFEEDARRRDFTFNGLYMDENGTIHDYFEGEKDLKKGVVRFIGNAEERIREDYLRILRYFRFHGKFSHKPRFDSQVLKLIQNNAAHIQKLSAERITSEIFKILSSQHAPIIWQKMEETNICANIGFKNADIESLSEYVKTFPSKTDPLTMIACLYNHEKDIHFIDKLHIKLSNKEKKFLKRLFAASNISYRENIAEQIHKIGKDIYISALTIKFSNHESTENKQEILKLINDLKDYQPPQFPIKGADLIKAGIKPGSDMGEILKNLESWWLKNDFPDKKACLEQLDR